MRKGRKHGRVIRADVATQVSGLVEHRVEDVAEVVVKSRLLLAQVGLSDHQQHTGHREQQEQGDKHAQDHQQPGPQVLDYTRLMCVGNKTFHVSHRCTAFSANQRREARRG